MALNKVTLLPIGVRGTHRLGAMGCLCKKVFEGIWIGACTRWFRGKFSHKQGFALD